MQVVAVVPARYASKRFPAKALTLVDGVPLVRHVAQRVVDSGVATRVVVATDDERIAGALAGTKIEVVMSSERFACGTDRVASAVRHLGDGAVRAVLNVQGDEARVDEGALRAALSALSRGEMGTVATQLTNRDLDDPNAVKVEIDGAGLAVAFQRSVVRPGVSALRHVGIYAFTPASLERFSRLPPDPLECQHRLEQLRALQRGWRIGVEVVRTASVSINTPADLDRLGTREGGHGVAMPAPQPPTEAPVGP